MVPLSTGFKVDCNEGDEEATFLQAMLLSSYSAISLTLKAVIELGVLEIISRSGPGAQHSAAEIVAMFPRPPSNPEAPRIVDRMLTFLASYELLTCTLDPADDGTRRFGLERVCRYLVKNEDGVSLGPPTVMNQDKVFLDTWHHLNYAVVEGVVPFEKAHGVSSFQYLAKDQRFREVFNKGLSNQTTVTFNRILDIYQGFGEVTILIDVGGCMGATLHLITSKYPHIKAICFDLPHVIAEAPPLPGIERVGGDMFAAIPTGGDAILLKLVLHNWSDEHCVKILKNCWAALPVTGKVIVVECILPEGAETSMEARNALYFDLCMLTIGGLERRGKEYESLARKAGFSTFRPVCYAFGIWVMELHK